MNMNAFQSSLSGNLINEAKTSKEAYGQLKEVIERISKEDKVELVYIMSKVDGKEVILALSGTDDYLTEYSFTPEQEATLSTPAQFIYSKIYKDEYGTHKSAYYSIEGTDSMLGIDMNAKFISDLEHNIIIICIALTAAFILIGTLVMVFVSNRLTRPLIFPR